MSYDTTFESYVEGRILSVISTDGEDTVNLYSGYVTNFSDSFNPTYKSEGIFGNTDPLRQYTATERTIQVSITLVAATSFAAERNLEDTSKLVQFTYPVYAKDGDSFYVASRPEVKVKLMNLIVNHTNRQHLPGFITNLSVDWALDNGVFEKGNEIYPKEITLSFNFLPEHKNVLGKVIGADKSGEADTEGGSGNHMNSFPYGYGAKKEVKKENPQDSAAAEASDAPEQAEAAERRKEKAQEEQDARLNALASGAVSSQ
jgi:hypothetical protein